jgi:hypothetical protein
MIASGAVQLGGLTVGGGATFSQNVGATIGDVKVLNGGIVSTESGGVGRVNSIEIRSGGQFHLRIGTDLSVGDVTVFAGGSFGINNYDAAARISGALVLDLSGAKGNTGRYMVYSSFNNVHGSRIVKASEEIGNYTYKLVSKGGDNSAAYNFTLDASGNRYTLARGGSVVNPLAKMTYTAGSSAYSGGADIRLTTVVDGAYTITAVDTAAALATKGEAVNTNDKMARWTENTTATSAVNLADGMTTGNAWLEIDGLAFDKALYGTAENQNFAGAVNVKLTSGSIRNLAAGAAKGGTVRAANFTMAGGTLAGAGYAGGFGNVTDEVNTTITAGTLASGKDFYAGALANYAKTGIATTVGNVSLTVKGGEFGGNLYGASAVKASVANAHTAGNVTLKLIDGNTAKADFCCFAGGYATGDAANATVYTVGDINAEISGGSWGEARGGRGFFGGAMASGVKAEAEDVTVTISGGSFGNVYGGGWAQKGGTSIVGNVNISIEGGNIANVFGGGSHSNSGGSTETGDVAITVSGGNITGAIYARGQLDGDTTGAADVIFTGATNFECGVYGYSYVGGEASDATLSYTGYTGIFSGEIGGFASITLGGATAMTIGSDVDVSNGAWEFDTAERDAALAGTAFLNWTAADFADDTITLNLADGDATAWTLVSGAAATEYGEFDVLVDGSSILDAALALDEQIVGGVWDGWGFTVEDTALKFKQLA